MICSLAQKLLRPSIKYVSTFRFRKKSFDLKQPQNPLVLRLQYGMGFFKGSYRNQDYAITLQIKAVKTKDQLTELIKKRGQNMNLIHLTTILDRMQEQQMTQIQEITSFVISRLQKLETIFHNPDESQTRAICNILCYLGNIKNNELNYLFKILDLAALLSNSNNIEKTMLINGIIKLGLFEHFFQLEGKSTNDKKMRFLFDKTLLNNLDLNQLLSIWFSFFSSKLINEDLHKVLKAQINEELKKQKQKEVTLRTFTYALIYYSQNTLQGRSEQKSNVRKFIQYNTPSSIEKNQYLMAHQMALLLQTIHKLSKRHQQSETTATFFYFSKQFNDLLNSNFRFICKQEITSLRNVANIYKPFNQEGFNLDENTAKAIFEKTILLIDKENKKIQKSNKENGQKVNYDTISVLSLFWKLNQKYSKHKLTLISQRAKLASTVQNYLIILDSKDLLSLLTAKDLLMLYSGFSHYCKQNLYAFQQKFAQASFKMLMNPKLSLTLKEMTFLYSYFKQMKLTNPEFCQFIKRTTLALQRQTGTINRVAQTILEKEGCLMNLGPQCKLCFSQGGISS